MSVAELLTDRLRRETRDAHEKIESTLDLFSQPLTLDRYLKLLRCWLSFYSLWEARGAVYFPHTFFHARLKQPALQSDLAILGPSETAETSIPFEGLLATESLSDALGILYVVEGSTLGGQIIAQRLSQELPVTPTRGMKFFSGYGVQTAARWRETKALINQTSQPNDQQRVVESANATFAALTTHLTGF